MHGLYVERCSCFPENYTKNCFEVPRYVHSRPEKQKNTCHEQIWIIKPACSIYAVASSIREALP